jgi:prepilin-type N-terminal cleavage/methylation domain-containing protein
LPEKGGDMLRTLKNSKGFTMIELFMVFAVLSILAQIAFTFMIDLRSRSSDVMALSDGKNLVTIVRNNFIALDDVDYTHNPGDGSDLGTISTVGGARPPVFTLSPGVEATITGESDPDNPGAGYVVATLYHESGTKMGLPSVSGRREFYFVVDELGEDILDTF